MDTKPLPVKEAIPPKPPCSIVKGYGSKKDAPFLSTIADHNLIRDNFTISTWLLLGAACQCLLLLLPIRPSYAIAPALLMLGYKLLKTIFMCFGLIKNPHAENVIHTKTVGIYPSSGNQGLEPSSDDICILLLNTSSSHPLGLFAPGFKDMADQFKDLIFLLDAEAPSNGFLGGSSWLGSGDRTSSNEIMSVMYFRSHSHLQAFAHGPQHRKVWDWWNSRVKSGKMQQISISHEMYSVPKGRWEMLYVNNTPSNFAATSHWVTDEKGVGEWKGPLVPGKGKYRTALGRMGKGKGDENEKYGEEPYSEV